MRAPIPGILPPGSSVRITPAPPLADNEATTLASRNGPGGEKTIETKRDGGSIILTNLTGSYVPYLLAIADKRTQITVAWLMEQARNFFTRQVPPAP